MGRRDLEGSRSRAASESDRMSATRGVLNGQNVWVAKWVSPEETMCPIVVNRMSLAGRLVHLSGSVCPAAICAMGSSQGDPLNFQLLVCKLDIFCPFCLLNLEGAGKLNDAAWPWNRVPLRNNPTLAQTDQGIDRLPQSKCEERIKTNKSKNKP